MRTDAEYEEAMRWMAWGLNPYQTSRLTGLPRGTISNWKYAENPSGRRRNKCPMCGSGGLIDETYAYLLGSYLGDGYISRKAGSDVYRFSITQDARYIGLIGECAAAIDGLLEGPALTSGFRERSGCIEVVSVWRHWPCLFPQHGSGRKHQRSISLEPWQQRIVDAHPHRLMRGLIHSDGCRYLNVVDKRRRPGGYAYPCYAFTNASSDIRRIFCSACRELGVRYRERGRIITISRRADVEVLDTFIGPKV